ncbi:LysM peptidoglycan-binding domain-containing protein [Myceligenerans crystallogenes]|uniref:LysM domain-containing protein n=1 Tax=Myceligenerans crystallogenes TaxID=316335 RepID=A0ABN2NLG3_9MICO
MTTRHHPTRARCNPAEHRTVPGQVTAGDRLRGLAALLLLAVLLLALPAGLVIVLPGVLPDWMRDPAGLRFVILGGDWGRLLLLLFWLAGWAVWLSVMVMAVREAIDLIRRARVPHFAPPPSGLFSRLVATVSLLFAAVPAHAATAPSAAGATVVAMLEPGPGPGEDGGQESSDETPATAPTDATATSDIAAAVPVADATAYASWETYTVRRNDTLWKLAEIRLGNGKRYTEIFEANREALGEPGYLRVGTTLRVPPLPSTSHPPERSVTPLADDAPSSYTVEPDDTLRKIAADHYGDAGRYTDIATASADTLQPGGERLTDSDHIEPGWTLTLPPAARDGSGQVSEPGPRPATSEEAPKDPDTEEPSTSQNAPDADQDLPPDAVPDPAEEPHSDARPGRLPDGGAPAPETAPQRTPSATNRTAEPIDATATRSPWLLAGIASGGGLLAAGLAAIVARGRRRQAAFRNPGRMIPPVPDELVPVAATARVIGAPRIPDLHRLDLLLRESFGPYLRQFTSRRPELIAVELDDDTAVLHLAEPADLESPWAGEGTRWSAPLSAAPEASTELVPFPMLVTVGTDTHGHPWLLDLEHLRTATITGEPSDVARFVRHVVVELAMNPWTINLTTDVIGPLAPGASRLSEYRVEEHDDAAGLARFADDIRDTYDIDLNSEDIEWYHAVIVHADQADDGAELAEVITADPGRNGLAVLVAGDHYRAPTTSQLEIRDGQLTIPSLDVAVDAVHLEQEELDAAVQLCRLMDHATDTAIPINPDARGWRAFVDEAGTPRPHLTTPRPTDPDIPAGTNSVLPDSDSEYLDKTANTRDDLARLAPVVPVTATVESSGSPDGDHTPGDAHEDVDPTLDQDLADWADTTCTRPRVRVLGPINMRAAGPTTKVADKMPSVYAILGFVALHPDGVIASQIAAMAGIETTNVRSRLADVRDWLGNRPDGTPWLPLGRSGRPSAKNPPHRFRVDGCLIDADLFLRLKARAYRRGDDGLADFVSALRLVRGRPFTLPRPDVRWVWATEGEHRDAILTAAISDVAQIVIAGAVLADDVDLAHEAYRIGSSVDPDGEVLKLSRAMLELADGHPERARDLATEILAERGDESPPDEKDRTSQIARRMYE